MTFGPGLRKLVLIVHLVLSIGWIGAVIAYLALDVAAVNADADGARMSSMAMSLIGWWVIVPLAVSSLLTGLLMALGTPWGLFRHYWVLISFLLTTLAVVVLITHLADVSPMAQTARTPHAGSAERAPRSDFLHAGGGLVVLLFVTALNVYKPRGLTPYGWRKQNEAISASGSARRPRIPPAPRPPS